MLGFQSKTVDDTRVDLFFDNAFLGPAVKGPAGWVWKPVGGVFKESQIEPILKHLIYLNKKYPVKVEPPRTNSKDQ